MKQCKLSETERAERLTQHAEIWKNKTLNEIAKRIEKAHLYSFNLPNFRSNLSKSQLEEWDQVFKGAQRRNAHSLDERYSVLKDCLPEKAHSALALLNVQNALEFDIARQYLMGYPLEELEKHNQLAELRKIIESGAKYPRVHLGEYLRLNTDRIKPSDFPDTRFRVLGVSNTEGVFLNETKPGAEINQAYYRVKPNEFCYNPYRVNVGSIGLCEFDYDNQIISGAYNVFGTDETELLPQYLMALFKSPQFLAYVKEKAHGGVRMNFKFEDLEGWEVPLPTIVEQSEIYNTFKQQMDFINYAHSLISIWRPTYSSEECVEKSLGQVVQLQRGFDLPISRFRKGIYPVIGSNGIIGHHDEDRVKGPCVVTGRSGTIGKVHYVETDSWPHNTALFVKDFMGNDPRFVYYMLQTIDLKDQAIATAVPTLDRKNAHKKRVLVPPVAKQKQIAEQLDSQFKIIEEVKSLCCQYQRWCERTLDSLWDTK